MKNILPFLLIAFLLSCSSEGYESEGTETGESEEVPELYQLKLSVNGQEQNIFQLVEFSLKGEGALSPYDLKQVYDSITWCVGRQEGSVPVFFTTEKGRTEFSWLWSHRFYWPGEYEAYLLCYKDGKVVHGDTIKVSVVNDKEFLMYDWAEVTGSDKSLIGFSNALDEDFSLCASRRFDGGLPGIRLYMWPTLSEDEAYAEYCSRSLYNYIFSIYGEPMYDREDPQFMERYQGLFTRREAGTTPVAIWLTPTSKIVLLDKDWKGEESALVYAEPLSDE